MKIGVITHRDRVNANYRSFPLVRLTERGHQIRLDVEKDVIRPAELRGFDVVHVYRFHHRSLRAIVRDLHAAGVAIVWDNDDDLAAVPKFASGGLQLQNARSAVTEMLRIADVVTTTSEVLAEQYRSWGAREVVVVDNYVPDDFSRASRHGRDVVIGWTAADEHRHDLEQLGLTATLRRLLDAHPQVRVESVGIDLRLPPDRYRQTRFVQYRQLADAIADFDIGIAPLADIPFNRARSNVKLKEYGAVCIPWLASPVGPYLGLGERQGGRLVADGEWYEALDRLVTHERERRKLAKKAEKWAHSQTVGRNLAVWERPLELAVERAQERRAAARPQLARR